MYIQGAPLGGRSSLDALVDAVIRLSPPLELLHLELCGFGHDAATALGRLGRCGVLVDSRAVGEEAPRQQRPWAHGMVPSQQFFSPFGEEAPPGMYAVNPLLALGGRLVPRFAPIGTTFY